MRLVVADASPLHYLILVDVADILSHLFETVHIPVEVRDELTCEAAPPGRPDLDAALSTVDRDAPRAKPRF